MATIEAGRDVMTLVNIFTVEPAKQDELIQILVEATEKSMKHQPGFVSASIHRSFDGKKVINYAQWQTKADFETMQQNPEAKPHMKAAAALASFEPIVCEVVESISAD